MEKKRYLDGLRGIAAIVVVFHHYVLSFYSALQTGDINKIRTNSGIELIISKSPLNLIYGGNAAVCIFFILSGYVLTYKCFKYKDNESIKAIAIKRYFRLMPPVLFSVFVAYIFMKLNLFFNLTVVNITLSDALNSMYRFEPSFYKMIRQGIYGAFFEKATTSTYNGVLWTMYYEFCGSFVILGFAYLVRGLRNRLIIYLIVILLASNTYFLPFLLGMFLCDLHNSNNDFSNLLKKAHINIGILILGLFLCSYLHSRTVENTMYAFMQVSVFDDLPYFYHSIGAFLLVLSILNSNKLKTFFSNRVFLFLGDISFSMYLIHVLVLSSYSCYLFFILNNVFRYNEIFIISFISSAFIIILVSYIMYKYIDLNSIKLSKKIYTKYFKNLSIDNKNGVNN